MVKKISITICDSDDYSYYPGSRVTGKVVISVDKPKKYKNNIAIGLYGAAHVQWTEGDASDNKSRVYYDHIERNQLCGP